MTGRDASSVLDALGDGFELVRVLGAGGGGSVVLMRQVALDRLVAVKTLLPSSTDTDAVARLRREGKVLAGLSHPGIVTVYRMVEVESAVGLVMEFVDGTDLDQCIRGGTLSASESVSVLADVADALTAAHRAGVVHRDIKPGNVLIGEDRRARVADFGLARLAGREFRTDEAIATGTPQYMSPEQILSPHRESPSMDAYGFGVVTFRMLTGRHPFVCSNTKDLLRAHLKEAPPDPREFAPWLPEEVSAVVLSALAKDPACRATPRDVTAVLASITDWDERARISARRPAAEKPSEPISPGRRTMELPAGVPLVEPSGVVDTSSHTAMRRRRAMRRRLRRLVLALMIGVLIGAVVVVMVRFG